jgi:site-specific recombinase XerD
MTVAPRTALSFCDWPDMDKALWAKATQTGDFLEADGKAAHWAAPTKLQVQKGYGKWLFFQNLEFNTDSNTPQKPSERISEATLRAYLAWLEDQGLASQTIASRITDLTEALRVMEPAANLDLLRTLCTTLQGQAEPSRNKHARIRAPREIWKACEAFMLEIARSENPLTHPVASRYRDAMILGVLSRRPLRRRNIASLALGVQLTQDAGKWYCHIPHTETKDGRSIEFALPQDAGFTTCFSYYLQVVRQKLIKLHPINQDAVHTLTGPLWVSTRGQILTDHALYYAVTRISKELLGKPLYPHLLRDCSASAMSSDAPEYILAASRILGHSSLKTTLSHYEQSSMLAAGARLVEHMSALQAKLEAEAPEAFFDELVFDALEEDLE